MSSIGYTWNLPASVFPRLVAVLQSAAPRPNRVAHYTNAHWVLDYAISAAGHVRAGSARAPWRPRPAGSAHLYPPGTPYWEDTRRDLPATMRSAFILFTGGEALGLRSLIRRPWRYARFSDGAGDLRERLEALARLGQARGEAGAWAAQGQFYELVDGLLQARHHREECYEWPGTQDRGAGAAALGAGFSARVEAYLQAHLAERVTLTQVARQLNVSLSTLAHRYRAEAGRPPLARLIELRMNLARGLLLRGLRLDQIAAQTGFYDAYHLSKTFKKHIGLAPRAYLQQIRKHVD